MARILVVDDDAGILKVVSVVLARSGHEIRTSKDPREALEILKVFVPELIISDISMPYMSGLEFLEEIRKNDHLAPIPFIFLSSHAQRDDIRRGMNLGADDYLTKPFTNAELQTAVDARLRRMGLNVQADSVTEAKALGTAQVIWQGQSVSWVSRKALELFFYLLEYKEVSSWQAAEALWPEKDESRASSLFHTTLHRLRKSLHSEAVTSQNRKYELACDVNPEYDVQRYERLAKQAEAGHLQYEELKELVSQYGTFLPGTDSPWVDDVRARLEQTQMNLLGLAAEAASQAGKPKEAVQFYQKAINIDPMSESDWRGLTKVLQELDDPRAEMAADRDIWWATDFDF